MINHISSFGEAFDISLAVEFETAKFNLAILVDQNVARLDATVHHVSRMHELDCSQHLVHNKSHMLDSQDLNMRKD